ncbi:MAG: hypothetical protein Q9170_003282 [Blastenia crenularia]
MKALILNAENRTASFQTTPKPCPAANEILIKVVTVALNPIDSLYVCNPLAAIGRTIGSDFAGVVEILGNAVPQPVNGLRKGSRVAGFLQGACSVNDRPGAFAEYLVCPWDLVWQVSDQMRLQEAAAMSLCGLTAAQALFYRMGIAAPFPWPAEEPTAAATQDAEKRPMSIFIYGATTSVGLYAAQLVRLSPGGRDVILLGAASPKHFSMLQREPYGYSAPVDYQHDDWPAKPRTYTYASQGVDYVYDCISEGSTVSKAASTLAPRGNMAIVRSREGGAWTDGGSLPSEPSYGAVWEGLGEMVQYQGMDLPANRKARSFATAYYKWLSSANGTLKANPLREMPGGLEGIIDDGFALLGSGSMGEPGVKGKKSWVKPLSGEKMVYNMSGKDTS